MEKINTPLMQFNSIINTERFQLNDQLDRVWDPSEVSKLKREIKLLDKLQERLKSLLPAESEVIEEAHLDGQKRSHSPSKEVSENYYSQTFKGYEKA